MIWTVDEPRGEGGRTRRRTPGGLAREWGVALEPRLMLAADVLTYHNDNLRTGQNLKETVLTPSNVNTASFGRIAQVPTDGAIYAQPLVKSGVSVPGLGVRNVVYVATMHDSVDAFDADSLAPIWHDSFINPAAGVTPVPAEDVKADTLTPEAGITSTPVIDPSSGTIYVLAATKEVSGKSVRYVDRLHALDLGTGAEKFGGPVEIHAAVPGTGAGSFGGRVVFHPKLELQRSGLLLLNGVVTIGWGSYGDRGPYHGWLMSYDARTLRQLSVFNVTPNGKAGSLWMSGGAPAADAAGRIFVSTGNGSFNPIRRGGRDYGDSVLKLSTARGLAVADFFSPSNQAHLNSKDLDLGSGGVLLLPDQPGPHTHLLVTAGKEGTIYLIDRDHMGRYHRTDRVVEKIRGALNHSFDTPAYFNDTVYYVGTSEPEDGRKFPSPRDTLQSFRLSRGLIASRTEGYITYGYAGSTPSISADGPDQGIVWTLDAHGVNEQRVAILRAYDANDVTHELYDSNQAGLRDHAGLAVTFAVPTVANGRVFVGGMKVLTVYGLLGKG